MSSSTAGAANIGLTGITGGPVIIYPSVTPDGGACEIAFFDVTTGSMSCPASAPHAADIFAVNNALVYAITLDGELHSWEGASWALMTQFPDGVSSLWADDTTILVAGVNQGLYRVQVGGSSFERVPNVPAGDYTSVWSTGSTDIWLGGAQGQIVHWNGTEWRTLFTDVADEGNPGITDLQGSGDSVFFLTSTTFGFVDASGVRTVLTAYPADYPSFGALDMHVASSTEVFLTANDSTYADTLCGGGFLVWYDGDVFHQF